MRLRHKYPEEDVTLLWTYAPHNYVLLFQTPSDIPENAVVDGMKDYVDSMCRENDRLGLFTDYHSSPIVSDFETIRPDLMGYSAKQHVVRKTAVVMSYSHHFCVQNKGTP